MPRTRHSNARRSIGTITVRELLDALEAEDPEALVVFASDYGDIGHTQQVHRVSGDVEEVTLEESAYSHSGWAIRREEDDDDDEDAGQRVLVIR